MTRWLPWLLVVVAIGAVGYGGYVFFLERLFGQETGSALMTALPYSVVAALVGSVAFYIRRRLG